jgi:hypothetical protein
MGNRSRRAPQKRKIANEWRLWVDLTRSPSRQRMAGVCANRTAGVDVSLPFAITAKCDSRHFSLSIAA